MALNLESVLETPFYGYEQAGQLVVPSRRQLFQQLFIRLNIFKTRKNWLNFFSWACSFALIIPLAFFFTQYFSWPLCILGFFYAMVAMGTHGTIYLHRYCSHGAYKIKNKFWKFIIANLVIKIIPEEIYAVSHLVHHKYSEQPRDPYNVHGGWWYCFLADAIHNPISHNLSEPEYNQLRKFMHKSWVNTNSFASYQVWGTLARPLPTILSYALNWSFWYASFYLIGGHALACCIFGWACVWAFGVRTFNYDGHGGGKDKRVEGIDFNQMDLSINQLWPGYVASEWHNNHHLFPNGARCGFLPYQLDLAWVFIKSCHTVGIVTKYNDPKAKFVEQCLEPFKNRTLEDYDNRVKLEF